MGGEPERGQRAEAVDVAVGHELYCVEPNDRGAVGDTIDDRKHLEVREPARLRREDAGDHGGIETVDIDGDEHVATRRNVLEDLLGTVPVHLTGGEEMHTASLAASRSAGRADPTPR